MKYNFDEKLDRSQGFSAKYDELELKFGRKDLCSMWVADMDFRCAEPIIDAIKKRADQGVFGYTSRPESYFEAMANWYERRYSWTIPKELTLHSPSVVTSLSIIIRNMAEPGDRIIIQPPVYYPFFDVIKENKRELVVNPLKEVNGDYVMDYEDLEKKIDNRTTYLILCNPHNPVGRVWSREELVKLGNICLDHNVKVISDEIHGDMVYGKTRYTPFASISEAFSKNTITCFSATKIFNIAGLQASFVIFPDKREYDRFDNVLKILDIKRNSCFNLVAVEAAYSHGEEWLEQLLEYLDENIRFLHDYCRSKIPEIKPNKPQGTYLVWLDCRALGLNDERLNNFMINSARVALDAGTWFGKEGSGYMRINVACPKSDLEKGLKRLENAVTDMRNR